MKPMATIKAKDGTAHQGRMLLFQCSSEKGPNAMYALLPRNIAEELHQQLLNTSICAMVMMLRMLAVITTSLAMVLNHRFLAPTMQCWRTKLTMLFMSQSDIMRV